MIGTIAVVGGVVGLLLAVTTVVIYFWAEIAVFFIAKVLPWLTKHVSGIASEYIKDLFVWLDGKVCPIRTTARRLIKTFMNAITGQKTIYTQKSADEWEEKTETTYRGREKPVIASTVIEYDSLPPEVREEILRQDAHTVIRDNREAVLEKAKQRAKKDYGDEELVMSVEQ
ncbi:MAG: hypothetical protein ABSE73_14410 [Planctomycetota bacterium]